MKILKNIIYAMKRRRRLNTTVQPLQHTVIENAHEFQGHIQKIMLMQWMN